jgi:hypothetical protein
LNRQRKRCALRARSDDTALSQSGFSLNALSIFRMIWRRSIMGVSTTTMPIHGEATDDQVMDSVADAVRDASKSAVHHANAVKDAITGTGIIQSVSRATYTGAYAVAFGIVYATVFVTQFLPRDNPVMHGFSDGARAAVDSLKEA